MQKRSTGVQKMNMKINTRCNECDYEFPEGELKLVGESWACPKCESPLIERILEVTHKRDPYTANVKYEEGHGHD